MMFKKSYLLCIPTFHDTAVIKTKRSCQLLFTIIIEALHILYICCYNIITQGVYSIIMLHDKDSNRATFISSLYIISQVVFFIKFIPKKNPQSDYD